MIGNENIANFFRKSLCSNRIAGAYIFQGHPYSGKEKMSLWLSQALLCSQRQEGEGDPCGTCPSCRSFSGPQGGAILHSDFYRLDKDEERKNISIEQVRDLIERLSLSSFLDSYKVGIIGGAEALSEEAANALLKTLEEPKDKVIIILLTENIESMPKTIASRCQIINFRALSVDAVYEYLLKEKGLTRPAAKHFSHLSLGYPELALRLVEDKDLFKDYEAMARAGLVVLGNDLNRSFAAVEEVIAGRKGQEGVTAAKEALTIWIGLARDLLLLRSGQNDLMRNEFLKAELDGLDARPLSKIILFLKNLESAGKMIDANVSPANALKAVLATS